MKRLDFDISVSEALRYAGHRGAEVPRQLLAIAQETAAECRKHIYPRYTASRFSIKSGPDGVKIGDTDVVLQGEDIKKHLAGCSECYIICVTAGMEADGFIRSMLAVDTVRGMLADGCATAAVESCCDCLENRLREKLKAEEKYLTWRYSPGYGDFPFTQQPQILSLVQAAKFAGVTCNESCIMTPSKSVTAVMGIASEKPRGRRVKCDSCPNKNNCNFSCR